MPGCANFWSPTSNRWTPFSGITRWRLILSLSPLSTGMTKRQYSRVGI